jgi:uncharacterized membrane protein
MNFSAVKAVGALGAFLMAFPLHKCCLFLDLVGVILVLLAFYELSGRYRDSAMLNYALAGFLAELLSVVVIIGIAGFSILTFHPMGILGGFILAFLAGYLVMVFGGWMIKKSVDRLATHSPNVFLKWAGLLIFLGAVFLILFGIGFLLIWIGEILLGIGFLTLRESGVEESLKGEPLYT